MNCCYCGASLDHTGFCPECDADVRIWKKVQFISNRLYNEGLAKAQVCDLSGAVESLKMSLRYNKMNMEARNLLGLVYFELGESVNAVSEWVISKSLIAEHNPAEKYLSQIQKNNARLENLNQTIKKFNQALNYCKQENYDLAVIQLKKVLSLNPKLVKAHQLMALLYMREERYDLAKKVLKNAGRVDANNTITLTYLKECNEHLRANGKPKSKKEDDVVSYQSGNDIIIRPTGIRDNTALMTVINLLIGAAIGVAVVCFLIVPEIRQNANNTAKSQLVTANETISTREQTIKSLESQIEDLNTQLSDAQDQTSSADKKTSSYSALLDAYVSYMDKDYAAAAESFSGVNRKLLGKEAQAVYDEMGTSVKEEILKSTMEDGLNLYGKKEYEAAIKKFKEVVAEDEGYDNGNAAYYLAYAYMYTEDDKNALKWFNVVLDKTTSTGRRNNAKGCIEELQPTTDENTDTDSEN